MRSRTSGIATTSTTALLSRAMTSGGVPAGANSAFQPTTSKRGRPLSAAVGTSGSERAVPDETIGRTWPSSIADFSAP